MMRYTFWIGSTVLGLATVLFASTQASDDEKQIRAALDKYLHGIGKADISMLREAWDVPYAHMKWVKKEANGDERVAIAYIEDMIYRWTRQPAESYSGKVLSLDIIGTNTASVKYEFKYGDTTFLDFLTLFKRNGQWRLVNKVFITVPK